MRSLRRWRPLIFMAAIWLLFMLYLFSDDVDFSSSEPQFPPTVPKTNPGSGHHDKSDLQDIFKNGPAENGGQIGADHWWSLPKRFPIENPRPLPKVSSGWRGRKKIPKIQAKPPAESGPARELRLKRQAAVAESFVHSWSGYKKYAWLSDEVTPLTGRPKNPFGGWAATLVDALDSLWIMGLTDEFEEAVAAALTVDFSKTRADRINVFETTIRYLGGYLSAYELSGSKHGGLLRKATEVAELLMCSFDTENHMPIARWDWKYYMTGHEQSHTKDVLVSELGSLSMEFTKLSQLTGDVKYYDMVQRISDLLEKYQSKTKLPGMWPVTIKMSSPGEPDFTSDNFYTLGGMSDSLYEYFPKQYLLLGGALEQPRKLYENFIGVAKKKLFKRVFNPADKPIIISGDVQLKKTNGPHEEEKYINRGQHLTCFVGGMVGIASKIFNRPEDLDLAAQLTEGCVWAYGSIPVGVMPERFLFAPCGGVDDSQNGERCAWDEREWRKQVRDHFAGGNLDKQAWDPMSAEVDKLIRAKGLVPGFVEMTDKKYILRPEAIESVFIMYRLTADSRWMEAAWTMFEAVEKLTRSGIAAAGVKDVTGVDGIDHVDSMESFWLAETLKYFYLVFSDWDVVDLDRWVLNTEAHPMKRPDVG